MKRIILSLLAGVLLFVGCGKDDIATTTDTTSGATHGGSDTTAVDTTDYDRTVTVVFSATGEATVSGAGGNVTATVSGNDVTIRNTGNEKVMYLLSGSTSDGFFKIYSGKKQAIALNGVSITNMRGSAINVQGLEETPNKGKRVDLVLGGSSSLADGSSYTLTPEGEDEKGVIFSEGKIVLSGSGSLSVNATGNSGITSDDWLQFTPGVTVKVTSSAGNGVRGKDYVLVSGGTLDITVSANGKKGISSDSLIRFEGGATTIVLTGNTVVESGDTNRSNGVKADHVFEMNAGSLTITNSGKGGKGISCDGEGYFRGGTVDITVTGTNFGSTNSGGGPGGRPGPGQHGSDNSVGAKGIKCDGNIEISGGKITVKSTNDEGIETKGMLTVTGGEVYSQSCDDAINSASTMTISGGYLCALSTGNDGLDANGNCYIQGGVVYAVGKTSPEVAIDANTEGGYKLYIQGGTVIAIGGLENGAQLSQDCYQASSWTRNAWYSINVGDRTLAFKTPTTGGTKLVLSTPSEPTLKSGVTLEGGTERFGGIFLDNPQVSGGNSVTLTSYTGGGRW